MATQWTDKVLDHAGRPRKRSDVRPWWYDWIKGIVWVLAWIGWMCLLEHQGWGG